MDEATFQQMLDKIDAMTSEEYWALYHEAQKLPDFMPDWESVPIMAVIDTIVMFNNISFSTEYKDHSEVLGNSRYSESEDTVCLQAA